VAAVERIQEQAVLVVLVLVVLVEQITPEVLPEQQIEAAAAVAHHQRVLEINLAVTAVQVS
jgi:hypothetical protein